MLCVMRELLKDADPKLLSELVRPESSNVDTSKVFVNSGTRMIWKCSINPKHLWVQTVRARIVSGYGCPFCSGNRTLKEDSLGALYPELLENWAFNDNKKIDPFSISPHSNRIVVWRCERGHERNIEIHRYVVERPKCAKCIRHESLLVNKYPEIAVEFHPNLNAGIDLEDLISSAHISVWWQCSREPDHVWQALVSSRVKSKALCPQCKAGGARARHKTLDEHSPELAKQWCYEKNGSNKPSDYTAGSRKKAWWVCPSNPKHVWEAAIYNRALKSKGCPKCAPGGQSLLEHSPHIASMWHTTKNGDLSPSEVSYGSSKKVWWRCKEFPDHEWDATVVSATRHKSALCPYCAGYRVDHRNSLATNSPQLVKEWHTKRNGELTPVDVTNTSGKKVWWICKQNPDHEWQSEIKNRSLLNSGCPVCWKDWNSIRRGKNISNTAYLNTEAFKAFATSVVQVKKMNKSAIVIERNLHQSLYRMLFVSVITAMETYLCKAFQSTIESNQRFTERLLLKNTDFSYRKFSNEEVILWMENSSLEIEKYIDEISWHNLPKIRKIFHEVLEVIFPYNKDSVYRAVSMRHDIVHRNGVDKKGNVFKLTSDDIEELVSDVIDFVLEIDLKLVQTMKTHTDGS